MLTRPPKQQLWLAFLLLLHCHLWNHCVICLYLHGTWTLHLLSPSSNYFGKCWSSFWPYEQVLQRILEWPQIVHSECQTGMCVPVKFSVKTLCTKTGVEGMTCTLISGFQNCSYYVAISISSEVFTFFVKNDRIFRQFCPPNQPPCASILLLPRRPSVFPTYPSKWWTGTARDILRIGENGNTWL